MLTVDWDKSSTSQFLCYEVFLTQKNLLNFTKYVFISIKIIKYNLYLKYDKLSILMYLWVLTQVWISKIQLIWSYLIIYLIKFSIWWGSNLPLISVISLYFCVAILCVLRKRYRKFYSSLCAQKHFKYKNYLLYASLTASLVSQIWKVNYFITLNGFWF